MPDLEGIADTYREAAGLGPPVDPFVLARSMGLTIRYGARSRGQCLVGTTVHVAAGDAEHRQGFTVMHEAAHHLLRVLGYRDTERRASELAAAFWMPRRDFEAALQATRWDLYDLREFFPRVSHEALARRIASLRSVVVTIVDPGRRPVRTGPAEEWRGLRRMTAVERELVDEALANGGRAGEGNCRAWAVEGDWRRVIVVCELEELAERAALAG